MGWSTVGIVVLGAAGYAFVLNAVVFDLPVVQSVAPATGGIVRPTLVANLAGLFVVFVILRWRTGSHLRALGINWGRPRVAGATVVLAWFLTQVVGAAALVTAGESFGLTISADRFRFGLGTFLAQVAGVALFEEVVYRGLLLGQLLDRLKSFLDDWAAILGAIVLSAVAFAIVHVPHRLRLGTVTGSLSGDMVALFVVGVTFAVVYLRTGSLLVTIGFHALYNRPVSPVLSPEPARAVLAVVLVMVVIGWPLLAEMGSVDSPLQRIRTVIGS
jgi:membrane protease YdiL (CAAX protease family)